MKSTLNKLFAAIISSLIVIFCLIFLAFSYNISEKILVMNSTHYQIELNKNCKDNVCKYISNYIETNKTLEKIILDFDYTQEERSSIEFADISENNSLFYQYLFLDEKEFQVQIGLPNNINSLTDNQKRSLTSSIDLIVLNGLNFYENNDLKGNTTPPSFELASQLLNSLKYDETDLIDLL